MVKSAVTTASSRPQTRSTKPSTKPSPPTAASSSKDDPDTTRPAKKARVEIGGTTTSDKAVKATPNPTSNAGEEKKPLKSALKNGSAKVAVVVKEVKEKEKEKEKEKKNEVKEEKKEEKKKAVKDGKKQAITPAAPDSVSNPAPASKVPKGKGKGKAEVQDVKAEVEAEPVSPQEPKIDQDAEMEDVSTTTASAPAPETTSTLESTTAPKSKSKAKAKAKAKKPKEAPAPPLPKSFKVVAGSYEKLLYGLQGTVTLSSSAASSASASASEGDDAEVSTAEPSIAEVSTTEAATAETSTTEVKDGDATMKDGEKPSTSADSLYTFTLKPIFIFPAHVSCIKSVAASPQGGKWLATGSADEIIKVWDLKRRKEVGGLMHHQGSVTTLTFPSRSHLLSASEDGTLALFRARDWSVLRTLKGHKGRVNDIAVHPSGKVALSVGRDGVLRMWDLMRGKGVGSTRLGGKKVEGVEGSGWKEGERVVWAVKGGVFAVQSGQGVDVYATNMDVLHTIKHSARIHDVKFVLPVGGASASNPNAELLLVAAEDKKTTVYEINTSAEEQNTAPRIVAELIGHTNRVKAIETIKIALPSTPSSPSPSTTLACTVSSDGFIHIYDLSPISGALASSGAPIKLEPVARYDTNKTRLTCVTVADGETEGGVVGGKRKRGDGDEDEDAVDAEEDDEDEGKYGEGDEHDDEEDEEESGDEDEEDEGEGEYEMESD